MKKVLIFQVLLIFIGVLLFGGAVGFAKEPKPEYFVDESSCLLNLFSVRKHTGESTVERVTGSKYQKTGMGNW